MKKVKFIKNPVGKFGLAYTVGMEAELSEDLAKELIESGYAEPIEVEAVAVAEAPKATKKTK